MALGIPLFLTGVPGGLAPGVDRASRDGVRGLGRTKGRGAEGGESVVRSMVGIAGLMVGGSEGNWLTGEARGELRATSCVTVRVAEVISKGPVSARSADRERTEVSSDLPTWDKVDGETERVGLEETEG